MQINNYYSCLLYIYISPRPAAIAHARRGTLTSLFRQCQVSLKSLILLRIVLRVAKVPVTEGTVAPNNSKTESAIIRIRIREYGHTSTVLLKVNKQPIEQYTTLAKNYIPTKLGNGQYSTYYIESPTFFVINRTAYRYYQSHVLKGNVECLASQPTPNKIPYRLPDLYCYS